MTNTYRFLRLQEATSLLDLDDVWRSSPPSPLDGTERAVSQYWQTEGGGDIAKNAHAWRYFSL